MEASYLLQIFYVNTTSFLTVSLSELLSMGINMYT